MIVSIFPIHMFNSSILAANNINVHSLSELNNAIENSQNNAIIVIKNNIYIDEEPTPQSLEYSFDSDENVQSNNENFIFKINNKKITIKGASPNITITAKNSMGFFKCDNNADLTLDNIILDGGENFKSQPFTEKISESMESITKFKKISQYSKNENAIRCNENCKLTMSNCTVQNCCTLNNALICISGSNACLKENNKIINCACYQSSPIYIMSNENHLMPNIKSHVKVDGVSLENCIVTGNNTATAITVDEMSYLIIKNITTNNCTNVSSDIKTISVFNNSKCFFYDENAISITIYNENGYIRTLKKYQNSDNLQIVNKDNLKNTEFVNKISFDSGNKTKNEIEPIYLSDNEFISDLKTGPLGSFYTTFTEGGTQSYKIPTPTKLNHTFLNWIYDINNNVTYETNFEKDTQLKSLWINENNCKINLSNVEKTNKDNSISIDYNEKTLIDSNTDISLTYTIFDSDVITNTYEVSLDGGNNYEKINNLIFNNNDKIKIIESTPNRLKLQLCKNGKYNVKIKAIDKNNNYRESDISPLITISKQTNNVLRSNKLQAIKKPINSETSNYNFLNLFPMQFHNLSSTYTYGDDPFTISIIGCDKTNTIKYSSSNPDVATIDSTGKITINQTGNFKITATQTNSENSEISKLTSEIITVNPRPVTINNIIANNKVYDGTDIATLNVNNAYIKGKLAKDALTFKVGFANFENKNVEKNKTVRFSGFELLGNQKDNYKLISQPNNTIANITPKSIKITNIKIKDKIFDGTNSAEFDGIPTLSGGIEGEDVSVINGTPTFSSINIGENIPINFTHFSLIGNCRCNYSLIQPTNIKGNIICSYQPPENDISPNILNNNNTNPFPYLNYKLETSNSSYPTNSNTSTIDLDCLSTGDEQPSTINNLSESIFNQKDDKTGIWVCAPAGVFNPNAKLSVKEISKTSSEFIDLCNKITDSRNQNINNTQLFEIHVENEKHEIINPNISKGLITVRIPIPDSYNPDKFKIYRLHQNPDNEINKQIIKINEKYYYEFQTNNFTTYATVNEQTSNNFTNLVVIAFIISASTIALVVVLIKLKNNKI